MQQETLIEIVRTTIDVRFGEWAEKLIKELNERYVLREKSEPQPTPQETQEAQDQGRK